MFKLIRKDKKKGFTLVELIVVIAILAILALILVPAITGYVAKANSSRDQANARALYSQAVLIATDSDFNTEEAIKTEIANQGTKVDDDYTITITGGVVQSVTYGEHTFPETPTTGD